MKRLAYLIPLLAIGACAQKPVINGPVTTAQQIEGTYIGPSDRRINISSYQNSGTHQYTLIYVGAGFMDRYQASLPVPLNSESAVPFRQSSSAFHDDKASSCTITAQPTGTSLNVTTGGTCSSEETNIAGAYAYSPSASTIPAEYQGKWDVTAKCDIPAVVEKRWITSDTDYGAAEVIDTFKAPDGALTVKGIEQYEDTLSPSEFKLLLSGDHLSLTGNHHGVSFQKSLIRCK